MAKSVTERIRRGRLRRGNCPEHDQVLVQAGWSADRSAPTVRCTAKWCRFKTVARKGTPLYLALFSETPPAMELDIKMVERDLLDRLGKIIRSEYPGITLQQLGELKESFPTLTFEHIKGSKR